MKAKALSKRPRPMVTPRKQSTSRTGYAPARRRSLPPHWTRNIAFAMIGLSVLLSYKLTPLPVAIALTLLAGIRIWIWQREVRREQAEM